MSVGFASKACLPVVNYQPLPVDFDPGKNVMTGTIMSTERQRIERIIIPSGKSYQPLLDPDTENVLVTLRGMGRVEIEGEASKTVAAESGLELSALKICKIFNDRSKPLCIDQVTAKWTEPTAFFRTKEDCEKADEVFKNLHGEEVHEYVGETHGRRKGLSVAGFQIKPQGITDNHYHDLEEEIYVGVEGEICVKIDGVDCVLQPNNALEVSPGKWHQATNKVTETFKGYVTCSPAWRFGCAKYA